MNEGNSSKGKVPQRSATPGTTWTLGHNRPYPMPPIMPATVHDLERQSPFEIWESLKKTSDEIGRAETKRVAYMLLHT